MKRLDVSLAEHFLNGLIFIFFSDVNGLYLILENIFTP